MPEKLFTFPGGRQKMILCAEIENPDLPGEVEYVSAQQLTQLCTALSFQLANENYPAEKTEVLIDKIQRSIVGMGGIEAIDEGININDHFHSRLSPHIRNLAELGVDFT